MQGVVIDKKLFSRAIKDRKQKAAKKEVLEQIEGEYNKRLSIIKTTLVEKLTQVTIVEW